MAFQETQIKIILFYSISSVNIVKLNGTGAMFYRYANMPSSVPCSSHIHYCAGSPRDEGVSAAYLIPGCLQDNVIFSMSA